MNDLNIKEIREKIRCIARNPCGNGRRTPSNHSKLGIGHEKYQGQNTQFCVTLC